MIRHCFELGFKTMDGDHSTTNPSKKLDSNLANIDIRLNKLIREKEKLIKPTTEWIQDITECITTKLADNDELIVTLGATDDEQNRLTVDDLEICMNNFKSIANSFDADCTLAFRKKVDSSNFYIDEILVRKRPEVDNFSEIRIAVVGNVDSGKSTLLGVLTHCELDNGRGLARQKLFRHKHEIETGRTSSIGNDILGFDSFGNVVNKPTAHGNSMNWTKICEKSSKVITFIDLAGHEKYLKTTIYGMTGHCPDYVMLMIGANAGIVGTSREHLTITLALCIPVFMVITKIDMCPPNILQETLQSIKKLVKSIGCRKTPIIIKNEEDVSISVTNFASDRLCPIFQVSNVDGTNLNYLRMFLNLLNSRAPRYDRSPQEFQIDEIYSVPGVGTVVSGLTLKGTICVNDVLLLGPNTLGQFFPAAIKSIHRKRLPVGDVRSGQTASFALKKIRRSELRKGMVMISPSLKPKAYWEFEAEILVLHHPTTISARYQAMVHCGNIRQTAQILSMNIDCLRTGDKARVHFRFIKNPEYIQPDMRIIFREGRTKAVGKISKVLTGDAPAGASKNKRNMHPSERCAN